MLTGGGVKCEGFVLNGVRGRIICIVGCIICTKDVGDWVFYSLPFGMKGEVFGDLGSEVKWVAVFIFAID